jgi:hypothetical protein
MAACNRAPGNVVEKSALARCPRLERGIADPVVLVPVVPVPVVSIGFVLVVVDVEVLELVEEVEVLVVPCT